MKRTLLSSVVLVLILLIASPGSIAGAAGDGEAATPSELVGAYDTLADSILAIKKAEWHMVHSILATTYNHAQATLGAIKRKLEGGQDARQEIEKLADLISQLGNEGDAAVGAIRKRLVDGGHHHNAQGEQQGVYDEGFVIVTRAAKKAFLASAGNIAKMSASPDIAKLEAEWRTVTGQYKALVEGA